MSRKNKNAKKKINLGIGFKNAFSKMKSGLDKAGGDIKGWGDKLKDINGTHYTLSMDAMLRT